MVLKFKMTLFMAGVIAVSAMPVAAESLNYLFSIRLGAVKIGEMRVKANDNGSRYSAAGSLYTTGVAGALYNVRFDSDVSGTVAGNGQYLPVSYSSKSFEDDKTSTSNITYSNDRVSAVSHNPSKSVPASATSERDTVDPMTLIYLLLRPVSREHICGGSYDLFDGDTRLHVTYTNPRQYTDGRIECTISYSGGGGGGIVPSSVVFAKGEDGRMHITRFSARTNIGALTATLR